MYINGMTDMANHRQVSRVFDWTTGLGKLTPPYRIVSGVNSVIVNSRPIAVTGRQFVSTLNRGVFANGQPVASVGKATLPRTTGMMTGSHNVLIGGV